MSGRPAVGSTVHVDFRKWPDAKHYQYDMEVLGHDRHGTWLCAPRGMVFYRGEDGPFNFQKAGVKLIPAGWWAANWIESLDPGRPSEIYVDIIQPAAWEEGRVIMVDLDLDIQRLGGRVKILDEDEFLENQLALAYPAELVEGARLAADRVYRSVVGREEPFGEVGRRWLEVALRRYGAGT